LGSADRDTKLNDDLLAICVQHMLTYFDKLSTDQKVYLRCIALYLSNKYESLKVKASEKIAEFFRHKSEEDFKGYAIMNAHEF